jgi:hypothetical protein
MPENLNTILIGDEKEHQAGYELPPIRAEHIERSADDADGVALPPSRENPAISKLPLSDAENGDPAAEKAARELLPLADEDAALSKAPPAEDPYTEESFRYFDFVIDHAHERYRDVLTELYHAWEDFNQEHFEGKLNVPHLTIAAVPPRSVGLFKRLTDWGSVTQLTIDARILNQGRRFVHAVWPAEGIRLLASDVLLNNMVKQYLAEIEHYDDEENAKYGEAYTDIANRIGKTLGVPEVFTRRRGNLGKALANLWPINVRPEGYYLGHVTPPGRPHPNRGTAPRGIAGVLNLFRHLLDAGQPDKLATIVRREAHTVNERACTAKPSAEKGEGTRLDSAWLNWNGDCIKQMLHAIRSRRMFDLMPLLADALSLAGCSDELLLTHCRLPVVHTRNCWVLKALNR